MASISTISDYIKFIRYNLSVSRTYHVCGHVGQLYFIQNLRVCIGCVAIPHTIQHVWLQLIIIYRQHAAC
jgi:hypothetical protein